MAVIRYDVPALYPHVCCLRLPKWCVGPRWFLRSSSSRSVRIVLETDEAGVIGEQMEAHHLGGLSEALIISPDTLHEL